MFIFYLLHCTFCWMMHLVLLHLHFTVLSNYLKLCAMITVQWVVNVTIFLFIYFLMVKCTKAQFGTNGGPWLRTPSEGAELTDFFPPKRTDTSCKWLREKWSKENKPDLNFDLDLFFVNSAIISLYKIVTAELLCHLFNFLHKGEKKGWTWNSWVEKWLHSSF